MIANRQPEIDRIVRHFFPERSIHRGKPQKAPAASAQSEEIRCDSPAVSDITVLSDDERTLLDRARAAANGTKFSDLFDRGDLTGYAGDQSRADLALCSLLAYWTDGDAERIERLFSASALGQREKWTERSDYPERTIERALDRDSGDDGHIAEFAWQELSAFTVPAFPVAALPTPLREWVEGASEQAQTPPDLAAMAVLSVLSAAALGVSVDCGSWIEELALYTLTALPSGDRKSTVLKAATKPLREIERDRQREAIPRVKAANLKREVVEKRIAKLTKAAADATDPEERKAVFADLEAAVREEAEIGHEVIPRLLADDATPEALAGLVATYGQIAIVSAESALIDNVVAGRYSDGGANLHLICMGYNGEATSIDRRSRSPEYLEHPLFALGLVVQPHVLRALINHPIARGQGFVARLALSVPTTTRGGRTIGTLAIPEPIVAGWERVVGRVATAADGTDTTTPQSRPSGPKQAVVLRLSNQASQLLIELQRQIEPRLRPEADLDPIADWVARHHGRIARVAGLLHLCEHSATEPISGTTMQAALRIGQYFLVHAQAVLTGPDAETLKAIDWLTRKGAVTVTQRDLQRGPLGSRGSAGAAAALADKLVSAGVLRRLPASAPGLQGGQTPSRSYQVHPDLVARRSRGLA